MTMKCRFLSFLLLAGCLWAQAQVAPPPLIVKNVTLIDGTGKVQPNVSILVSGGKIDRIAATIEPEKNETVIDGSGKFVIPGLIDTRVQLTTSPGNRAFRAEVGQEQRIAWLHSMLRLGITTARDVQGDIGEQKDLRTWRERDLLNSPALLIAGPTFTAPGGSPANQYTQAATPVRQREVAEVSDEAGAGRQAGRVGQGGADSFEIVYSSGAPDMPTPRLDDVALTVLINSAHAFGLKAFCWVGDDAEARTVLEKGCDAIEGVSEGLLSDETVKQMAAKKLPFVPSLVWQGYLMEHVLPAEALKTYLADPAVSGALSPLMKKSFEADKGLVARMRAYVSLPRTATGDEIDAALAGRPVKTPAGAVAARDTVLGTFVDGEQRAIENLKKAKAAGVPIVAGTGAGSLLDFPGPSLHLELQLMVQSGMTPADALQAATRDAAISLGKGAEFGTLEPGKRADFVILDANPLADIHNTTRVNSVVRSGRLVDLKNMDLY